MLRLVWFLPLSIACVRTLPDASVTVDTEVVTRALVQLDAGEEITAHVTYGDADADEALWLSTPEQTGSALAFTVYLHAGLESAFRVEGVDANGREVTGPLQTVTAGSLPSGVPVFDTTIDVTVADLGPWLLTTGMSASPEDTAVVITTTDGRTVWYWQPGDAVIPSARFDPATGTIYGTAFDLLNEGYGYLFNLPVAGGDLVTHPLTWAHHDAVLLSDGTLTTCVSAFAEFEGESIAGDTLVEVAPDGTERTIWSAFDHLTPTVNIGWTISQFPNGEPDWTHCNGIDYDEDQGAYYVSLWGPEQVVKIDRATGDTVWFLGGPENQFDFGDDPGFGPQHAPEFHGGRLHLFDNRDGEGSRAVAYALDEAAMTATLDWSFEPADPQWALVLGDVSERADGSHLMSWGSGGDIFVTDANEQLSGFLRMDKALAVGQVSEIGEMP